MESLNIKVIRRLINVLDMLLAEGSAKDKAKIKTESVDHPSVSPPVVVDFNKEFIEQYQADQKNTGTLQKKALQVQRLLCVFTFLAFLAAAYYAYVAKGQKETLDRQWGTMQDSLSELKKQTESIVRQETLTTQLFKGENAATCYLNISGLEVRLVDNAFAVGFICRGKVLAKHFSANVRVSVRSLPENRTLRQAEVVHVGKEQTPPNGEEFTTGKILIPGGYKPTDITGFSNHPQTIAVSVDFRYDNGFGDIVREDSCFIRYAFRGPQGARHVGWPNCSEVQDLIRTDSQN